jgi:hypothetical protein
MRSGVLNLLFQPVRLAKQSFCRMSVTNGKLGRGNCNGVVIYYPSMNIHGPKKLMDTKNNQNLRRLICSGMIAMSEYFTVTTLKSSLA